MNETGFLYPATPARVSSAFTQPSTAFKKEVSGVMGSIVFFFIVYLLLLLLSIGLVIGCVWAGIAIIINRPGIMTIAIGLGLIGVGVMVFIFLVKFMFSVSRYDRSGIIEISENEQPALFGFIRQLTDDTQTAFPKKIYLSGDVNACVFYDSSFWSMFFPVKKNLQIGVGLVNALNLSEFKAVMAHEFGHFSQRSMKLGSFVYNVNRIIHNMLFENRGYGEFLRSWANLDGVFAIFAAITARIAQGIQWVLREMYAVINKSYMRLSQEMEFHADAVAATVSGSNSLISALRRIEFAHSAYSLTLAKCDQLYQQNKISGNIYPNQSAMLLHLADQFKLPLQNGLPLVNDEFMKQTNYSRINYKDQWASHPTTEDREKRLRQMAIAAQDLQESAWILFKNRQQIEKELTQKIYEDVKQEAEIVVINEKEFEENLQEEVTRFSFPEIYNGFFNDRQISIPEPSDDTISMVNKTFDELFSTVNASLFKKINAATTDIEVLKAIAAKTIDTKTFDFDGDKYQRDQAIQVVAQLEQEKSQMQATITQLDKEVIQFFYDRAGRQGETQIAELRNMYEQYFEHRRKADRFLNSINEIMELLQPLFSGQTHSVDQVHQMVSSLKNNREGIFKKKLVHWREAGIFEKQTALAKRIDKFIGAEYAYFSGTSFFEEELLELNSICHESWTAVNEYLVGQFKLILEKQLVYIDGVSNQAPVANDLSAP